MSRYLIIIFFFLLSVSEFSILGQKYYSFAGHSITVVLDGISGSKKQILEQNTKIFLDAINKAYLKKSHPLIPSAVASSDVNIRLVELWTASSFFSVRSTIIENISTTSLGNYELRNLQIILEEAQKDYEQQDAVLVFDKEGRIVDFKIALSNAQIGQIMNDTMSVADFRHREMIVSFIEEFRTAYFNKDISLIEKVFRTTEDNKIKPIVQYTKQTQSEYLNNLKSIFSRAKVIDINFRDIKVVRHPKFPILYGVSLVQDWNTNLINGGKYHDYGYIFLIIDFSVEETPKILVCKYALEDSFSFDSFNLN